MCSWNHVHANIYLCSCLVSNVADMTVKHARGQANAGHQVGGLPGRFAVAHALQVWGAAARVAATKNQAIIDRHMRLAPHTLGGVQRGERQPGTRRSVTLHALHVMIPFSHCQPGRQSEPHVATQAKTSIQVRAGQPCAAAILLFPHPKPSGLFCGSMPFHSCLI